ncbi:hypothetical protein ZWY2020_029019 [Hordeum vulgare]|nr:hypothetical protein ZWY2020_029019 [Hordeum vulgare]
MGTTRATRRRPAKAVPRWRQLTTWSVRRAWIPLGRWWSKGWWAIKEVLALTVSTIIMAAARSALLLCSAATFIQSPTDVFGPMALVEPTPSSARDFGAIVSDAPFVILRLDSTADIALLLIELSTAPPRPRATMVARGVGHSLQGQAQARDNIVVETRSLHAPWWWWRRGQAARPPPMRTRTWAPALCGWRCWRSA